MYGLLVLFRYFDETPTIKQGVKGPTPRHIKSTYVYGSRIDIGTGMNDMAHCSFDAFLEICPQQPCRRSWLLVRLPQGVGAERVSPNDQVVLLSIEPAARGRGRTEVLSEKLDSLGVTVCTDE